MELEIKPLIEIDYNELTALYMKFLRHLSITKDSDYGPPTPLSTKCNIEKTLLNDGFLLGIYSEKEKKLVGTIGAAFVPVLFQNIKLLSSVITFYAIDPELLPLAQETQLQIFQQVIEKIKEFQVDFIWIIFDHDINSKEEKIFKKDLLFVRINRNVEPFTKLLGSEGVEVIKKKKGLNVVLAQLAKLMASMKTESLPGGIIRDATSEDYPDIVKLLNAYSEELILTRIWSVDSFKKYMDISSQINTMDFSKLKVEFPDAPCGVHLKVWERDQKIIAFINYHVMPTQFKNGLAPLGYWDYVAFSQNLNFDEKKAFVINMYNEIYRKACIITVFLPYYDLKAFDKSGFMSSRLTYPLYIFPLTEKGKKLLELKKISKFYLPYINLYI